MIELSKWRVSRTPGHWVKRVSIMGAVACGIGACSTPVTKVSDGVRESMSSDGGVPPPLGCDGGTFIRPDAGIYIRAGAPYLDPAYVCVFDGTPVLFISACRNNVTVSVGPDKQSPFEVRHFTVDAGASARQRVKNDADPGRYDLLAGECDSPDAGHLHHFTGLTGTLEVVTGGPAPLPAAKAGASTRRPGED